MLLIREAKEREGILNSRHGILVNCPNLGFEGDIVRIVAVSDSYLASEIILWTLVSQLVSRRLLQEWLHH